MAFTELDKEELKTLLKEVITETVEQHPLTDEEITWVRLAIESEARKAAFRKAVIEKTFVGLMSSALIGLCLYAAEFFKNHWK